jgi:alpha-tubulin suppressor-like RCC1 family protein
MAIRLSSSRMDMNDKSLERPVIRDYGEAINALGGGSGTRDIDLSLGNVVTATVTGTTTFTFSNPTPAGTACTFTLLLTNGGAHTVNWPAAVKWANTENNIAPTLNTAGVDILTFLTTDVGVTWYGFSGTAVASNDTLWTWGWGGSGFSGDGSTTNRSSPVQVGTSGAWTDLSRDGVGAAALMSDSTLWAWGAGTSGQLGEGTSAVDRSSPVQIGSLATWSIVVRGGAHTLAIKTDGTLWAWGAGTSGQLGEGATTSRSSPVQVGSLTTWSAIAAGGVSSHAIKTDGTLWGWGNNGSGQLGDGTTTSRSSPVQVGSLTTWSRISAGISTVTNYTHVLAIKTDGTLWGWGRNGFGQVGDVSTTHRSSPVQIGTATNWADVSASVSSALGKNHSVALKNDGTLWAWGYNYYGQIGDNSQSNRSSPVQVGSLTTWSAIAAGGSSSHALKNDGTLWAWGAGTSGQLGDGTITNRSSPIQIGSLTTWKKVATSGYRTIAIKKG